jgi:outer membrane biosynthesis protein TonB
MVTTRSLILAAGMAVAVAVGTFGYVALRRSSPDGEAAKQAETQWTTAQIGAPVATPAPPASPAAPPSAVADTRTPERKPAEAPRPEPVVETPAAPVASAPATVPPPPVPSQPPASAPVPAAVPPPVVEPPSPVPAEAPKQAAPRFEDVTITQDSVIGIRLETPVSSETAKVEDRVQARVTRDVMVDGRTAIPTGARLDGVVSEVDAGGKFKGRARVGIKFTQVVLGDNHRIQIQTETIYRNGESPSPEATAKIGASAVVGAIIGSVIGGKKGAAIGAGAGAAGGTAIVAKGGRNEAVIPVGALLTVRLTSPVKVTIERTVPGESR